MKQVWGNTRHEIAKALKFLRAARDRKTLVNFKGLFVTVQERDAYRSRHCGGCGREKGPNPKRYFGELFCADCVEKWRAGCQ